ncbi:MAG: methylenetetrahydrofolate reductase [NAD(P)H] [Phycisphaerales bacterium]|nr:methylenetetrahydrofolate reductase [NAD(P)H] [Phycisphaerales bacterium]
MKIIDSITSQPPTLSFEFFPPRDDVGFWDLYKTILSLKQLDPTYVSVTYGAGGSTRKKTVDLVERIKADTDIEPVAHLTCVGATQREIEEVVDDLVAAKIENILALRGDPPAGETEFKQVEGGFAHAADLIAFLKSRYDICVAGACHPEKHPEAPDLKTDLVHLKKKVDAGCEYLVTQLFFDNADFYRFREQAEKQGIHLPIIVGIMPILSVKQTKRFTQLCGASIPKALLEKIEAVEDDVEAVRQVGTVHALKQCEDLIANGVAGLHFYTLNRSTATRAIFQHINDQVRAARPAAK